MSDVVQVDATYNQFEFMILLDKNFSPNAFASDDARRSFNLAMKSIVEGLENHEITKISQALQLDMDAFNKTVQDLEPEIKIQKQQEFQERHTELMKRKDTDTLSAAISRFAWEKGFKDAVEKEGKRIIQHAKTLSVLEEWMDAVDEANKTKVN